ncbi:hypothetical protein JHK87_047645 [Glycine soja]|nr:hypothetical protein JHK87_047645 [Glycine soja]
MRLIFRGYTKPGPDASHEQRAKFIREKDSFGLEEHIGIDLSGNTDFMHIVFKKTGKASEVEVKDVKLNHPKEV